MTHPYPVKRLCTFVYSSNCPCGHSRAVALQPRGRHAKLRSSRRAATQWSLGIGLMRLPIVQLFYELFSHNNKLTYVKCNSCSFRESGVGLGQTPKIWESELIGSVFRINDLK